MLLRQKDDESPRHRENQYRKSKSLHAAKSWGLTVEASFLDCGAFVFCFSIGVKNEKQKRRKSAYNLRVADWHTYFVGCDEWGFSVWAHNACFVVRESTAGGFEVLRDGEVIKRFSTGNGVADKAAANSYRRQVQKLAEEEAAAAKAARAAEEAARVRVPINGKNYTAEFSGEAESFLQKHNTLRDKFTSAAEKGVVAPKGNNGLVVSELEGYDYKIKILGVGGDYRLHGRISGDKIIFDKVTTH